MGLLTGALAIGGSLLSSAFGSSKAGKANKQILAGLERAEGAIGEATRGSQATQREFFERGLGLEQPFLNIKQQSLEQALELLGQGFQFGGLSPTGEIQQREGEQAIDRAFSRRGGLKSGANIEALSRFNERLLAHDAEAQFGRNLSTAGALTNIGGIQTPGLARLSSQVGRNIGDTGVTGATAQGNLFAQQGAQKGALTAGQGGLFGQTLSNALLFKDVLKGFS